MLALHANIVQPGGWLDTLVRDLACSASTPFKPPSNMPTSEQHLRYFGLQAGDRARARDTECSICKENVHEPVVTECQHIYCYECIYRWFATSTKCPECRKTLYQPSAQQEAATLTVPGTPARFSSSQWVRASRNCTRIEANGRQHGSPTPLVRSGHITVGLQVGARTNSQASSHNPNSIQHLRPPLASTRQQRAPKSYQYRSAPLTSEGRSTSHQHTPSYGSAAYINVDYAPPQPSAATYPSVKHSRSASYRDFMTAEDRACAEIIKANGGRPPQSAGDFESAASRAGVIFCDSEYMLAHMWQTSNSIADAVHVPLRCRAIAKCVWREWRDFLRGQDGRWLLAEDVIRGLSRTLENAVVDYGWVRSWRELPAEFIGILRQTAEAGSRVS